ncbi:MAG: T9SS type A sorting domain-containing protein [Candidatus Symbiothrix sp.]|jgi:hypothetical protein|nr:T9SS type A sorting domain-containing protein [Candidatus Symbiothrix sp.]
MKRIFTLVVIAFSSISLIQSQVVLTHTTHGFTPGSSHECIRIDYQEPGDAGTNLIWDFSRVNALRNETPSSKSTIGENLTQNSPEGNVVISQDGQFSFLYNNTEKGTEYFGYKAGETGVTLAEPIVKTKYPQSFGDYFEGNYSGTVACSCESTNHIHGFYSTHADATGVILLPGNIELPALRVQTIETTEYDGASAYSEQVKYLWYAQSERFPVFVSLETYSVDTTTGEKQLTDQLSFLNKNLSPASPTGILSLDKKSGVSYKVFPNPFKNSIEVSYTLPEEVSVSIELYNSQGVKLATLLNNQLQKGSNSFSKDIANYVQSPDIYFLKLIFGKEVFTEKLIKEGK